MLGGEALGLVPRHWPFRHSSPLTAADTEDTEDAEIAEIAEGLAEGQEPSEKATPGLLLFFLRALRGSVTSLFRLFGGLACSKRQPLAELTLRRSLDASQ